MAVPSFEVLKSKIENAANNHYYIHLTKNDGSFKLGSAKMSSYITNMSNDNGYIYLPTHRLCGNYKVVSEYLSLIDTDEEAVAKIMATAYTIHNYKYHASAIASEIASVPKKDKKKDLPSIESIIVKGVLLKANKSMSKIKETVPTPSTPREQANLKDLKVKLYSLEDGQALDITGFNPDTKTGTRRVKRTIKGNQKSLGTTPELNRIVFTNKIDEELAVKFLIAIGKSRDDATKIVQSAVSPSVHSLSNLSVL
jgi:hypothetical protein